MQRRSSLPAYVELRGKRRWGYGRMSHHTAQTLPQNPAVRLEQIRSFCGLRESAQVVAEKRQSRPSTFEKLVVYYYKELEELELGGARVCK